MADTVTEAMIGTLVKFTSKNETDDVVWTGTVLGLVTYKIARTYGDVVSYRAAVVQVDDAVPAVEDLSYFLIQLDDVEGKPVMVFASEFIETGSLESVNQRVTVLLEVYDLADNTHTDILTVLRANGYRGARILSVSQ